MATQARLYFDGARETLDAKGWVVQVFDDQDIESAAAPVITYYATITLAQAYIQDTLSDAADVLAYFQQKAAATYLATNSTFGPFYFGVANAKNGKARLFFFVGTP